MLDLLVFTQHLKAYAPNRFLEEAILQGLPLQILSFNNLPPKLPNAKAVILREPDAKSNLYSLRDVILKFYLDQKSVILNQYSYTKWSILDKQTQREEFIKGQIPHVMDIDPEIGPFPYIAKSKMGSHGSHVFKIEKGSDLESVYINGYKKEDLLFQEFLSSGFDLRVIVLKNRVLGVMKRTPQPGEFLSNFSKGGTVEEYQGPDKKTIENIAVKTARHFKLDYVGVDLMQGNDGGWRVLEVNRGCQFKGFEKSTGSNVAREVLLSLVSQPHL